ncbi:MAG: GNAT family N-acetyltransferase, partial [Bradymonadaceae bacterium]
AYLLGDLDPAYDEFCNWYGARRPNGDLDSLMVHYEGLSLPPVLAVGSRPGVAAILDRFGESLPDRFHFHVHENHIPALEERFGIAELRTMRRLSMHRAAYQPRDPDPRVRGLGHEDTAAIMELYEYYPDNLFEPHQLETGLYFGIDADDGGLASIAGVHVVSQAHDIAAIGNLVTRPDERGRGLATACTAKLL